MKHNLLGIVAATALAAAPVMVAAAPELDEVPLTLTGCVVAGEAKDSFLLTHVVVEGDSVAPSNAFYRFDSTKDLKDRVGQRVEVTGKADLADLDKGELEVKVDKKGNAKTKISSERRTVEVGDNLWFGSPGSMKIKADVPTYKFEVDKVKRLEGNCK